MQIHSPGRVDLHMHSTFSDGQHQPEVLVEQARLANLTAIAITDHDHLDAYFPARAEAEKGKPLEVISGVEITCEYAGSEVHLLGYFVDPKNAALQQALQDLRESRERRFHEMVRILRGLGAKIDDAEIEKLAAQKGTLGRRHLGEILFRTKQVSAIFYAFVRFLNRPEITSLPKKRLPVREGIRLVHEAGGISSWAHPPSTCTMDQIREWQSFGLQALEAEYPWSNPSHGKKLRVMASQLGLAITGGSDFHGIEPANRKVGAKGITDGEFLQLKSLLNGERADIRLPRE